MRERERVLDSLEVLYREAFRRAEARQDEKEMSALDFQFQKDQLYLEAILDVRELLAALETAKDGEGKTTSLLEKARAIRKLTRLR